jgi:hypothetical protein
VARGAYGARFALHRNMAAHHPVTTASRDGRKVIAMDPRRDNDPPDDSQYVDLQSLKRALMRRDEAVERFRAAKEQLLRSRRVETARRPDPSTDRP